MNRTRKLKVCKGGHPVKRIAAFQKGYDSCHAGCRTDDCVSQTFTALGYLDKKTAIYLHKRVRGRGVTDAVLLDILDYKYGGDHRWSKPGISDAGIRAHIPSGFSTCGWITYEECSHAIVIVNINGHIGYFDPQQYGKMSFVSKLENRDTLRICYNNLTDEKETNNVVDIHDISMILGDPDYRLQGQKRVAESQLPRNTKRRKI